MNITDRAISKWENGRSLPDVMIMLDLCNELGISVNDLLHGEAISMDNYKEKSEIDKFKGIIFKIVPLYYAKYLRFCIAYSFELCYNYR